MSRPLVCEYLRAGGTLDALLQDYAVIAKRHRACQNLVLLKYNQIASPLHESIVRECRGIILDESDGWRVVGRGFDKFFNHGEPHADPIDWGTARVQEKVDGSLCTVYEYNGAWHVATTGTPDAGGDVNGSGVTFADYFWDTFALFGGRLPCPRGAARDFCFLFELTGPINRVVVEHAHPRLTLLAARDRTDGGWLRPADAAGFLDGPVELVREYDLSSFEAIAATFSSLSPLAQEGYVVVDGAFRRVKVKHPGYVALHHAKDGLSTRAFVEIARSGETPEVIAAFPELKPRLDDVRGRLDALVEEVDGDYARMRDIPEQKAFALQAVKTRCSAALFAVRARKAATVRDYFAGVHIDQLMKLVGLRADDAGGAS